MHQRQAGSYARRFYFGKQVPIRDLREFDVGPGIGLIPPEFDDLRGGELEESEQLRSSLIPP